MSNQEDTTKNQTTRFLTIAFITIGAVMIFIAPLVHIEFPKKNPVSVAYENELDKSIAFIDNELSALRSNYDEGIVSAEDYIIGYDKLHEEKANQLQVNKDLLKAKNDSLKIFDWKTMRIFLIGFGTRLPYLLFSFLITFFVVRSKTKDKYLNTAYTFLQITCYTISIYMMVWVFWNSNDFPIEMYRLTIIAMCIFPSIAITFFFKHYYPTIDRLRYQVNSIWDFLVEVRNEHYKKMLKRAIETNLYDEAYQEGVRKDTKEFEKRIYDKAEEILE